MTSNAARRGDLLMTQKEFGERSCGEAQCTVSRWERGKETLCEKEFEEFLDVAEAKRHDLTRFIDTFMPNYALTEAEYLAQFPEYARHISYPLYRVIHNAVFDLRY